MSLSPLAAPPGVYILPFCAFYYSAIFSALQLFTELFFIGYSKFFVYLHPTPLLNAKLIRFGPLLTKNHYFFNFFNQKSLILLKKIGKNPFFHSRFQLMHFNTRFFAPHYGRIYTPVLNNFSFHVYVQKSL